LQPSHNFLTELRTFMPRICVDRAVEFDCSIVGLTSAVEVKVLICRVLSEGNVIATRLRARLNEAIDIVLWFVRRVVCRGECWVRMLMTGW